MLVRPNFVDFHFTRKIYKWTKTKMNSGPEGSATGARGRCARGVVRAACPDQLAPVARLRVNVDNMPVPDPIIPLFKKLLDLQRT